jgi:hypothetical protein
MLGIELPTGSGSLRETSGSSSLFGPNSQAPVGGLDTVPNRSNNVIGSNPRGMQPIGVPGQPIGASDPGRVVNNGFSGGVGAIGGGSNNDMALLQTLLPGVNITSGNTPYRPPAQQQPVGVGGLNQSSDQWNGGINYGTQDQQQQQQRGNGIW